MAAPTVESAQAARIQVLSAMLRKMARRHGVLRRAYNLASVDPWERNDYCANATPHSPCGPALRVSGLCVECLHEENRRLRARLAEHHLNGDPG